MVHGYQTVWPGIKPETIHQANDNLGYTTNWNMQAVLETTS